MPPHTLRSMTPNVHWLSPDASTDRPILGIAHGTRHCLLIDTGNSPAHAQTLKQQLAAAQLPTPTLAMLTHWHWDHVFGSAAWNAPTFASRETARIMRVLAGLNWDDPALDARVADGREIVFCRDMLRLEMPDRSALVIRAPDVVFETQVTLDLGGISCELIHVGGDHAHDSAIAFLPDERVVFIGDCIYDDLYHGPRRLTTALLFPLLDRLLALDADFYVASHHNAPLTRAEFVAEAALYRRLGRLVETHRARDIVLGALGETSTEDERDIVDAFLAGLALPEVTPVY